MIESRFEIAALAVSPPGHAPDDRRQPQHDQDVADVLAALAHGPSVPTGRPTPTRRTAPRAPSWPGRGASWTSARCAGRSRRSGRRAPPRARRARPRRPRSASRGPCARLTAFFDGPAGFGAGGGAGLAAARAVGLRRLGQLRPLGPHAHVLGPAADVGPQRPVLDGDRARADGVQQRAVVRDEQHASPGSAAARPRAPRATPRSRWLVGSSSTSTLAPDATRHASDSRRRSPPESPDTGFSAPSPPNRNWPSSDRASLGLRPVARWQASSTLPVSCSSSACWESRPILTLWPRRSLPASSSRAPASTFSSVVLPVPLAPTSDTCSPRSSQNSAPSSSTRSPIATRPSSISKITRPERSGGLKAKPSPLPSCGSRDRRSILSSFFWRACAWRARVPARKRSTKRVSRSISASCFSIARPSASSRCAFSLRQACQVPAKKRAAAALELEHRGADRLQEPAVVRDEDDGGVDVLQVALEPLQRLDVEVVGRLVEQQQVGIARQRARQRRARELAAGERGQVALQVARRGSRGRAASR